MTKRNIWSVVRYLSDGTRETEYYNGDIIYDKPSKEELAAEKRAREEELARGPDTRLCRRVKDPLEWEYYHGLRDTMGILNDVADGKPLSIKSYEEKSRIEPPWGTFSWSRNEAIYIVLGSSQTCIKKLWDEFNARPEENILKRRVKEIYKFSNVIKGYHELVNNGCHLHERSLAFHCPYVQNLFSPYRVIPHCYDTRKSIDMPWEDDLEEIN